MPALSARVRSSDGCWTCRLRRKKCDESRPVCLGCQALEIDCLYSNEKPEWMDGSNRQREQAEKLKANIKRNASWRRERRYFQQLETGIEGLDIVTAEEGGTAVLSLHGPTQRNASPPRHIVAAETIGEAHNLSSGHGTPNDSLESSIEDGSDMSLGSGRTPLSSTEISEPSLNNTESRVNSGKPHTSITEKGAETPLPHNGFLEHEREQQFLMVYLDYIFPFLFPFYRPQLLYGGRGWLLVLLTRNRALFHSAISFVNYAYSVLLNVALGAGDHPCKVNNWVAMRRQVEKGLRELRADMNSINVRGVAGNLAESARLMGSVIQMLCFEATASHQQDQAAGMSEMNDFQTGTQNGNWQFHLDAALVLFEHIVENAGRGPSDVPEQHSPYAYEGSGDLLGSVAQTSLDWKAVIHQICDAPVLAPIMLAFNSDQAAMNFFSAVLVHIDIVSSTVIGRAPRLQRYHMDLLTSPSPNAEPHIDLQEYTGIRNWIMIGLAEIAALAAFKKEARATGQLSMSCLVARANTIEKELRQRLNELEAEIENPPDCTFNPPFDPMQPRVWQYPSCPRSDPGLAPLFAGDGGSYGYRDGWHDIGRGPTERLWASRIWAHAALLFLATTVDGWQPATATAHEGVKRTFELLQTTVPIPSALRSVAWPLCLVGCLACPGAEDTIRSLVGGVGSMELYGALTDAMDVMEFVWAHRGQFDSTNWDLASCFLATNKRPFFM